MKRHLLIAFICMLCASIAYAKPKCQGFNNYDNKVTIVFTDKNASRTYSVSDVKLITYGKEYAVTSVQANVRDGVATATRQSFPS
ncbi:MAG: hypothetical protein NC453_14945 [Muribaculum sp.]|nr:hypothetical protein [Muribaculum sp.]